MSERAGLRFQLERETARRVDLEKQLSSSAYRIAAGCDMRISSEERSPPHSRADHMLYAGRVDSERMVASYEACPW